MTVIVDSLVAASGNRQRYAMRFNRNAVVNTTSYWFTSLWQSKGLGGGDYTLPTVGVANGRACSKSTVGALQFPTPPSLKHWYLQAPQLGSLDGIGSWHMFDKLADVLVNVSDNGAITGCTGTARLATGEGGLLIAETVTAFSASANTFTLSYINQDGNAATTPSITTFASNAQTRSISNQYLYLPLASGDYGVRQITAINAVSGTATGTMLISIVRPVYDWIINSKSFLWERDLFMEYPVGRQIDDSACLMCGFSGNAGSTTATNVNGTLGLVAL